MTQASALQTVDSDRVDENRNRWRVVVAALIVGAVLGALVGTLYASTRPKSVTATTALSVLPDSTVLNTSTTTSLDASAFVQSQLVILNGRQLADSVAQQLSLGSSPSVNSTEVGQTYVVQLSASAATGDQAEAIATAASKLYIAQRTKSLTAQITQSLTATNAQIASVQAGLTTNAAAGVTPAQTALQTEYIRLLGVSSSLKLGLTQANTVATVLTPVSVSGPALSGSVKYGIGGAVLGAIAAFALLIVRQRTSRRVQNLGDVAALGVPVLLPVISRHRARARKTLSGWRTREARLLAARLTNGFDEMTRPIVVVGATTDVGSSFVASSLAASLSARGPVLLVLAAEAVEGRGRRELARGGTSVIETDADDNAPVQTHSARSTELADSIIETADPNVFLLPCDFVGGESGQSVSREQSALLAETVMRAAAAGWLVVVDAPALSESDLGVDCAEHAIAVLVVGRNRSAPADIVGGFELFAARGQELEGAVLNDAPRRWRTTRRSGGPADFSATWTIDRTQGSTNGSGDQLAARSFVRPPRPNAPATPGRGARRALEHSGSRPVRRLAGSVSRRKP